MFAPAGSVPSGPPAARQIPHGTCPQSISHGVLARVGRVRKGETRVAKGDPVRARLLLGDKIVHRYAFSYPSFAGLLPVRNFRELRTSSREETLAQTLKPLYESSTSITVTTPSAIAPHSGQHNRRRRNATSTITRRR